MVYVIQMVVFWSFTICHFDAIEYSDPIQFLVALSNDVVGHEDAVNSWIKKCDENIAEWTRSAENRSSEIEFTSDILRILKFAKNLSPLSAREFWVSLGSLQGSDGVIKLDNVTVEQWEDFQRCIDKSLGKRTFFYWRSEYEIVLRLVASRPSRNLVDRSYILWTVLKETRGESSVDAINAADLYVTILLYTTDEYEQARNLIKRQLELLPRDPSRVRLAVLTRCIWSLLMLGQYDEARERIIEFKSIHQKAKGTPIEYLRNLESEFNLAIYCMKPADATAVVDEILSFSVARPELRKQTVRMLEKAEERFRDDLDPLVLSRLRAVTHDLSSAVP